AAVELLRQLEKRLLGPGFPVGRAPDRYIERFLFNLIRDGEAAKKRARSACRNVEPCAIAVDFNACIRGNEVQVRSEGAHQTEILTQSFPVCCRWCPGDSRSTEKCLGMELCQTPFSRSKGFFFLAESEADLRGAVLRIAVEAGTGDDSDSDGFDQKLGEAHIFRIGLEANRIGICETRDVRHDVVRAARPEDGEARAREN